MTPETSQKLDLLDLLNAVVLTDGAYSGLKGLLGVGIVARGNARKGEKREKS